MSTWRLFLRHFGTYINILENNYLITSSWLLQNENIVVYDALFYPIGVRSVFKRNCHYFEFDIPEIGRVRVNSDKFNTEETHRSFS